jgi:hypothetical protein
VWSKLALAALAVAVCVPSLHAQGQGRFLGREEITLYGLGLSVQPAQQTVPKGYATIVSTYLQTPQLPGNLPPFAPDAEVRATLRGPSFEQPLELVAKPNSPLNVPILTVPGTHTVENIRLVSGGEVLLYGTPQSVRLDVIEKLLVTTVTARPLTADEIREKGIVFDRSNYQAYNFTAAFAVEDGKQIDVTFPVVLPTLAPPSNIDVSSAGLSLVEPPMLRDLATIIPDTLQIQSRIPNLSVKGFTLTLSGGAQSQDFYVPPIPGVIVIPGDIGFLNQYFSVMLMVANVAPTGSNLVVTNLAAAIVLPPGMDNVVGSADDPLRMAQTATGESARVQLVRQPGPDGRLGTGDDVATLGPGETGSAEYLIEGRREGTWPVEMEITGTLTGMPVGPVAIRGRAAGSVLVRNPKFTLTFTHPDVVNAGESYTLDVTVTNTSDAPANLVSVNLFAQYVSGARLTGDATKTIDYIAAGDSASVTYALIAQRTGRVTAATLDSDENIAGRFALKTGVGELGIPLSPDSLVLPKEAGSLPVALRDATLGLLGRAWAVATAPPAVFPKNLTRFSKRVVLDRAVETAEAGFRASLGEPLAMSTANLLMDFLGSEYLRLSEKVPANDTTGLLALLQRDVQGFDLLRRLSFRGDVFAGQIATTMQPAVGNDPIAYHRSLAEQFTSRPGHLSVLVSTADGSPVPVDAVLVDAAGRRLGGLDGTKIVKEIPFGDVLTFGASGTTTGRLLIVAVPEAGQFTVRLTLGVAADPLATYAVSVAYPAADGRLRFASFSGVGPTELPQIQHAPDDPFRIAFELAGVGAATPKAGSPAPVTDPAPTVLGAVQMAEADIVGCPEPESPMKWHGGRVIAVLFSEEVTAASVQDKLRAEQVTAFSVPDNRVVGVALQPGRRIAFVALRAPVGRFVDRSITVQGVSDTAGQTLGSATVPITMTVTNEGGVVLGQVLNADGSPAAFSEVRLFYEFKCNEEPVVLGIASQNTDMEGRFQFDYALLPPTLKLVALDSATDDIRVLRFKVARDSQRLNVNVVFIGRGTFAGRTLAENGTPLANSKIRITSLTDQSQYGATSDSLGRFEIQRVPVGNIVVEAVNADHPAQIVISERIPVAGTTITRDLTLLNLDMTGVTIKFGQIAGRVMRSDNLTPVEGAPVVAYYRNRSQVGVRCPLPPPPFYSASEPEECAIAIASTDAEGAFSFPKVTAGELRVYSFDQAALQEGQVRLTLAENQTASFNLLLGGGFGTVRGVVLDQNGRPVPDAEVGGGLSLTKVNPADGSFTLADVPVGRRQIVAVSQAMGSKGQTIVDIVRPGEVVNAAIVLDIVGAVAGRVFDHDGVPQAGITVYAVQDCYDEFGNDAVCAPGQATTDASGGYRINGLLAGKYRVSAFRSSMRDGNIVPFAIRYQGQVVPVDITFRGGGGTVTGRVLRAKPANCAEGDPTCVETPLPARVAISGDQLVVGGGRVGVRFEYVQNFQIVDNNFTTGDFSFSNLWAGPFTVRAAGQFSPEPVAVEGTMPGPGQTVNVDLRLQPTSRITGTVYEPDGVTPVTDRQVTLNFKSNAVVVFCSDDATTGETTCVTIPQGIQEMSAVTNETTGQFSFPIVNAGAFTITANDGARVSEVRGTVKAGETVDLGVRLLARGRVTVQVIRHDGQTPVPGASVRLQQIDYPKAELSGMTGPDGAVAWESLGEGQFVVSALDGNGFGGRASGRIAGDGDDVTVRVYLYDATGTVVGLVTRLDDQGGPVPVPNAEVVLVNSSGPIAFAVSDASGRYSVSLVPLGAFWVDAFDPLTAGRGRASGQITGGNEDVSADIRLEALGIIRGVLLEGGTLGPLKGWQMTLSQTTPSGRGLPTLTTTTSVDGSFSFPGASVGSFSLRASQRGIVGEGVASGQVSRAGQLVEVQVVATIVHRVTGRVTGLVANPNGTAAPSAQVEVCSAEGCRPTTAGADGRFELGDVPLGRFTVRASAQVTGAPSVGTAGGSVLFENDVADVTVTLLGLGVVEGTVFEVVNNVRTPAGSARVLLYGQPGSGCAGPCVQNADTDGRFRFVNVPARTFTVAASGLGQTPRQGSVGGVLNAGETKSGLEVVLEPAVSFSGRVLVSAGSPAAGVVAELTTAGTKLYAETGPDGVFTFQAVKAGAYALWLQDPVGPGIAKKSGTVDTSAAVALGDITLDETPPAVGSIAPVDGSINVPLAPEIRVVFTEPVNRATVNSSTIVLVGPTGPVTGEVLVPDASGDTVALFRLLGSSQLASQSRYSIRVSGVEDRLGKKMVGQASATFTTVDITPPAILETTPAAGTTGVSINTVVRVKFSEIVDAARLTGPAVVVTGPTGPVDGRVDFILAGTVAVFTPSRPLAEDATYSVAVASVTDLAGLQSGPSAFSFTTTDRTPPQVLSLTASNAGRVIENTNSTVTATVSAGDVAFVDFFINDVFVYTARGQTASFAMTFQALPAYGAPGGTIRLSAVATDTSGNRGALVSTTVAVDADRAPSAAIDSPAPGSTFANSRVVQVKVRGTDDVGVARLGFKATMGAALLAALSTTAAPGTDTTSTFSFTVPADAVPGASISIDASVADTKGQVTAAAPVTVTVVDAAGPVTTITAPFPGTIVQPGQLVTAVVSAVDAGGVALVGFQAVGGEGGTAQRAVSPAQKSVVTSFSFKVPAAAAAGAQIELRAYAVDATGNRADAGRVSVLVADGVKPTVTLRTETGSADMVRGRPVNIVVTGSDNQAVSTLTLTGTGAFPFAGSFSVADTTWTATHTFTLDVPGNVADGAVEVLTARATDASGNQSMPVTLSLTAKPIVDVVLPGSLLLDAGEVQTLAVSLPTPAAASMTVQLRSASPGVATITPSVTFAQGQSEASATVTGVSGGNAQIDAYVSNVQRASTLVTVQGGIVHGTVTDGSHQPVAGALVTVFHGAAPISTATADDGTFFVRGVVGTADGRAFTVRATDGTRLGKDDAQLDVPGGSATVTVVILPLSIIHGSVLQAAGGAPVAAGVQVDLYAEPQPSLLLHTVWTDANGAFEFRSVAPATYLLYASDMAGNRGRATAVVSAGGQDVAANITFLGKGTVAGAVRDGANNAVGYAAVELQASSMFGHAAPLTATADADGKFSFSDIFVGTFTVTASDANSHQAGSTSGSVTTDGQTVNVVVQLSKFGNLEGTVFRSGRATTVPGATVSVSWAGGTRTTSSDLDGRYSFSFLPFAPFTVSVNDPATRAVGAATGTFTTSGQTVTKDIELMPQGTLIVTVVDSNGNPVNDASVRVSVQNGGLTDVQTGQTGPLNGEAGKLLVTQLLVGPFTATASKNGLSGEASGSILEGQQSMATIQLAAPPPAGAIVGTVLDGDGVTPATGSVRASGPNGSYAVPILANGAFDLQGVRLGTYRLDAFDANGRFRAVVSSVALETNGQIVSRDLVFVGLGTVKGFVTNPFGSASGLYVTVRSSNATFGGYFGATTGAAGQYEVGGVPVGGVVASTGSGDSLRAEGAASIQQHGQVVDINLILEPNTFNDVRWLYDANNSSYAMQPSGFVFAGGVANIFGDGAAWLDIIRDGTKVQFSGGGYGTHEEAGRETVGRQADLHGLNVTRKFFVPETGFFTRVLESLTNPTTGDITVDVVVTSNMAPWFNGASALVPQATTNGNATIEVGAGSERDHWVVMDDNGYDVDAYTARGYAVPVSFVFDGPNGSKPISAVSVPPSGNQVEYRWEGLTIPAGGTVTLMHFVAQQVNRNGAVESARRLADLPPEALAGLDSSEIASIVNFQVPPDGVSAIAPLPALTGALSGAVLEGDGVTPVPAAAVSFRSLNPLFGRVWTTTADGTAGFSFAGAPRRPVPLDGFELRAQHPLTGVWSPFTQATLSDAEPVLSRNILFSDAGRLRGFVLRHTGAPVTSGTVSVLHGGNPMATVPIGSDGSYAVGGLPASASAYSLRASLPSHQHGTPPASVPTFATIAAGQSIDQNIAIEPTGTLEATLQDAGGSPVAGRQIQWSSNNPSISFSRAATTDQAGRVVSTDMPVGSYSLRSTMPSGFTVSTAFAVAANAATPVTLSYILPGTLTVQVRRTNGAIQPGVSVQVSGSFNTLTGSTDAAGVAVFTGIPTGQPVTVWATYYPGGESIRSNPITVRGDTTLLDTAGGIGTLNLTLPPFGLITGSVRKPDGSLIGDATGIAATIWLSPYDRQRTLQSGTSVYAFDAVPVGTPVSIRTVQQGRSGALTVQAAVASDGDVVTVDTRTPAFATVRVIVQQPNGSPIVGAQVHLSDQARYLFCSPVHPNNGVTNASGTIDFTNVAEGSVDVRIYPASPALPSNYSLCYGYSTAPLVLERALGTVTQADDGRTVDLPVVPQSYTVTVRGVVTLADGVTPVPNHQVEVLRAADYRPAAAGSTVTTNADGQFVVENATVTGAGVLVRTSSPAGVGSVPDVVQTAGLATGTVDVRVVTPVLRATVIGRVLTADGTTPVSRPGSVQLLSLSGASLWLYAQTETAQSTGQFAFEPRYVPAEGVRVRFYLSGLPTGYVDHIIPPLTLNDQLLNVEIRLPASYYATVNGRVVAAGDHQTPIESAWVEMLAPDATTSIASAYTNQLGEYQLVAAVPGSGEFIVRANSPVSSTTATWTGFADSQDAVIDLGARDLPISIVHGVVRYHDGEPVADPTVLARLPNGDTAWPSRVGADGSYVFYELPVGAISLTAQDGTTGLAVTADIAVAEATSVVGADLTMPPTGTVRVTVLDADGNVISDPTLALMSAGLAVERYVGPFETTRPEPDGRYAFTRVPLGPVYVQGRRDGCDGSCQTYTSGSATLVTAGETAELQLRFGGFGTVTIQLVDANGDPVNGDAWIEVDAFGSTGPLGRFQRWRSRGAGDTNPWVITDVPAGPVQVRYDDSNWSADSQSGVADGTLQPNGTLELVVRQGTGRPFPYISSIEIEGGLFRYAIRGDGTLQAGLVDGSLWSTIAYGSVALNVGEGGSGEAYMAKVEMAGRQLVLGPSVPSNVRGLTVVRRVYIAPDGRYARYLDTISNPTGVAVTTTVKVTAEMTGPPPPEIVQPSISTGGFAAFDGVDGSNGATAYVFSGANPPVLPDRVWYGQRTFHSQMLEYSWSVTVPANGSVSLLHFALADLPDQLGRVRELADQLSLGPAASILEGLTEEDLAGVINFRQPGVQAVTLRGSVVTQDGSTGVPNVLVEIYQELGNKLVGTATTLAAGELVVEDMNVRGPALILRLVGANATVLERRVPVDAGGEIPVTFLTDWMRGGVAGSVLTYGGESSVDAEVVVKLFTSGGAEIGSTRSDAGGNFSFGSMFLPATGVTVRAFVAGLPGGYAERQTGAFTENGQILSGDTTLPASVFAHFQGLVRAIDAASNNHVAWVELSAVVAVDPISGAELARSTTNADGFFAFYAALPADGNVILRAESPAGTGTSVQVPKHADSQSALVVSDEDLVLPITYLTGSVRFPGGTGVPFPSVFAIRHDGIATPATVSRQDGGFAFSEAPPGTYTLVAQDPATGVTVDLGRTVELPTTTSHVWYLDFTLPQAGTVTVRAVDEAGQPVSDATIALMADRLAFERRVGPDDVVKPVAGVYSFDNVPLGPFYLQGKRARCTAPGDCRELFASAGGDLQSVDTPLDSELAFSQYGQALVKVIFPTTGPIEIGLDAMGSAGPLGAYAFVVSGAEPTFLFDTVPPGPLRATIRQAGDVGVGTGWLDPGGSVTIAVYKNSGHDFQNGLVRLDDQGGFRYTFDGAGALAAGGTAAGALAGTFGDGPTLYISNNPVCCSSAALWELEWRQLVFGPMTTTRGLFATRKAFVSPGAPGHGFVRYLDTVSNPTDVPVSVTVSLRSPVPGATTGQRQVAAVVTPSATTGGYAVITGAADLYGASAYVFSGSNPPALPNNASFDFTRSDVARYDWNVSIPPRSSVALLHFAAQRLADDAAGAQSVAQDLANLVEHGLLNGLSEGELAPVINFALPGVHTVGVSGVVKTADGMKPVVGVWVDLIETLGNTVIASAMTAADGGYGFAGLTVRAPVKVRTHVAGLPGGWKDVDAGTITSDTQQFEVNVTLPPSVWATITGIVSAVDGGATADVDMARVRILRPPDQGGEILAETLSGRWGQFTFHVALPPDGRFVLRAESPTGSGTSVSALHQAPLEQGVVLDYGQAASDHLVLPITVVFGTITYGNGAQPVANPTVFARHTDGTTTLPTHSRPDGTYVFYELLDGSYVLTAQEPGTGLTAVRSGDLTLPTSTSVAGPVDWSLPPTGTVIVSVGPGGASGAATVALVSDNLDFERRIGPLEVTKPDSNGLYVFSSVPFGTFHLQGKWSIIDAFNNAHDVYADAHGVVESTGLAQASLDFEGYGQVQVDVVNPASGPTLFLLDALGPSGPLGAWSEAVELTVNSFQFDFVPPGPVRTVVRQGGQTGLASGLLEAAPAPSGRRELTLTAPLGNAREFQVSAGGAWTVENWGADLFRYPVDVTGRIVEGGLHQEQAPPLIPGTLQNALALALDGTPVCCSPAAGFDGTLGGDLTIVGPMSANTGRGVTAVRKVWIPDEGGQVSGDASGFAQVLDVVHNSTTTPVTVTVGLTSTVDGAQAGERAVVDRSGAVASDGGYVVIGGDAAEQYGASAYVYSGADPVVAPSLVSFDFRRTNIARTEWKLTLGPGERKALLHFVIQRLGGNQAGAIARARALAKDVVQAGNTLVGLTAEEKAMVVNFRIQ